MTKIMFEVPGGFDIQEFTKFYGRTDISTNKEITDRNADIMLTSTRIQREHTPLYYNQNTQPQISNILETQDIGEIGTCGKLNPESVKNYFLK
jgi:hypothetical protein